MLLDYDPDDIDVRISELLVATHESADPMLDPQVQEVLAMLREKLHMDVAFVSRFTSDEQVYESVSRRKGSSGLDVIQAGNAYALESSWCQQVVAGRAPQFVADPQRLMDEGTLPRNDLGIQAFFSTPVLMGDGQVYGTLCCLSLRPHEGDGEVDLRRLQWTARLLADRVAPPA